MAPVITMVQISVAEHALLLIASCSYTISSLETNFADHFRDETTNFDELLG